MEKINMGKPNIQRHLSILILFGLFSYVFFKIANMMVASGQSNIDSFFAIHTFFLYLPITFLTYNLFYKIYNLDIITLLIVITFILSRFDVIDNYVHTFLLHIGFYKIFFSENLYQNINSQYSKLIFYIPLLILNLFIIFNKKKRNIVNLYFFIISCSILVTTFIFHKAIPFGIFKYARTYVEAQYSSIVEDNTLLQNYCNKNIDCYSYKNHQFNNFNNFLQEPVAAVLSKEDQNIALDIHKTHRENIPINNSFSRSFSKSIAYANSRGQFNFKLLSYRYLKKDEFIFILNKTALNGFSRQSEYWFIFLTIVAHSFWSSMGILLLHLHIYKFKRKNNNNNKEN